MVEFNSKKWFIIEICILASILIIITIITSIFFKKNLPTYTLAEDLIKSSTWGLTTELSFASILLVWVLIFRKKEDLTIQNLGYNSIQKPDTDIWFYYLIIVLFVVGVIGFVGLLLLEIIYLPVSLDILVLTFSYACICAPVVEEFIFRGFLYKRSWDIFNNGELLVLNRFNLFYATLFTSILFGFFHLIGGLTLDNAIQVGYTFIGGLFFCRFKNQTNSIFTNMLFHSAWNLAVGLLGIAAISLGYAEGIFYCLY
ncbi:MAG: lysostaphin resistance A-like protein [Candidatus Helarchaeota archaeon]